MRVFAYFAFHSVINSFKKLFKTWIAVFFAICVIIGLVGGIFASSMAKLSDEKKAEGTATVEMTVQEDADSDTDSGFAASHGITRNQMIEGIVSLVVLGGIFLSLFNADGASKIFKPADVSLLFSSPMKPQSVMLFRITCSMGAMLIASLYMLFQLPNLIINAGLNTWGAVSLIICWTMLLISSTVFQVTLYTIASRHPVFKQHLTKFLALIIALIAVAFALFFKAEGGDIIHCAVLFFAGPATRYVPFWGWMRGFSMCAIEGNVTGSLIYLGLLILGIIGLIALIWNLDTDFYEDAIHSTEQMTERLERAQNGTGTIRKKDRSDKIVRDDFNHGWGGNVFFFKSMYNRFRFATLHIFTKTFFVYLGVALIASYFCQKITDFNGFIIVALIFSLIAFYRTLGNPLYEDTSKEFFVLIPETAGKKLLWSLFAGSVNCLMDIIVPLAVSAIWLRAGFADVVMWTLMILSIDFFGTTVGTFIGVSVPTSAGASIKQVVQIMFIYFGILPSAGLIIAGIALEQTVLFMGIALLFNLMLGAIFFALTPRLLENGNR